jgi:ketosteroid isomerase-like protein
MQPRIRILTYFTAIAVFAALTLPVPVTAQAAKKTPPKYYVFNLGQPLGGTPEPVAINNLGWISGAANLATNTSEHALLWVGTSLDLGTLGGTNSGVEFPNHSTKGGIVGIAETADTAEPPKPAFCVAPEYRQFDFWVGDWDAFDVENPAVKVAHNRVDRILDGCVLLENYEGTDGLHGEGFSIYDAARGVWHQSWVTNRGKLLIIEGKFQNGEMILSGVDEFAAGKTVIRGTWKPVSEGVRETAVTSADDGKTWSPLFDLVFRPHTATSAADDRNTVSKLDTEYQAAVKKNDAATMDRILADDFVLVTGSGKTYNKADLLEEARSGRVIYEHQEDTLQTVRLWGDTAVVTAKLWEKGTDSGKPFEYTVWFSDTYVRMPTGWQYVFGQSSLPLPKPPA